MQILRSGRINATVLLFSETVVDFESRRVVISQRMVVEALETTMRNSDILSSIGTAAEEFRFIFFDRNYLKLNFNSYWNI